MKILRIVPIINTNLTNNWGNLSYLLCALVLENYNHYFFLFFSKGKKIILTITITITIK